MNWTEEEKQKMLNFAEASDHERNDDMFDYISSMMLENGFVRTPSQIKSMYYKLTK